MNDVSHSLDQESVTNHRNGIIPRIIYPAGALILSAIAPSGYPDSNHPFNVTNQKAADFHQGGINLSGTHWERTALHHQLDPYLLYAIALVESSKVEEGFASPWPWALNKAGKALYPKTSEEAVNHVKKSIDHGESNIDIGLMQVNYRWHAGRAGSLASMIDPITNVSLGAEILSEAIASVPGDLVLGVGRYHAWQNRHEAIQYGERVLKLSSRLRLNAGRK